MNANKLAAELEGFGYLHSDDDLHFCPFQAQVDLLRHQQAEIEVLLKFIDERGETGQLIIWKAQEK